MTATKDIALNIPSNEKYERYLMAINVNGVITIHAITFNNISDVSGNIVCKESPTKMTSAVADAINSSENKIEIASRALCPNAAAPVMEYINDYDEKKKKIFFRERFLLFTLHTHICICIKSFFII